MRETARLVAAIPGARVAGSLPPSVDAIASDSRAVKPGTLFVALRGERVDGHHFVRDAVARGASAVVVEERVHVDVPAVIVPDTRVAASALADAFHDHPSHDLIVIGVTGTNGKTTTTHLVRDLLETAGIPCGVIGTLGGEFRDRRWPLSNTTPLAIELHGLLAAQRDAGAKAVAMEVSSHALALHRVDHVRFRAAALTNITRDHLDFHGTLQRYTAAKRRLFDLAPNAILNTDDPAGARFATELSNEPTPNVILSLSKDGQSPKRRVITYAIDADATLHATDVNLDGDGSTFRIGDIEVRIALPGRFNVRNALAAFGIGRALGIDDATIVRGLAATRAVPGRMERIGAFGIDAIVDYAHTPDALENVLRAARETTKRDLIVVFGCGGDRDPGKRTQMGEIAARLADRVIVTSDNPRSEDPMSIAKAVANGYDRTHIELDRRRAIRRAIDEAHAGDTVVVAGKGHETYQIVGDQTRPFDDRDEVRIAFSKRADTVRR
ncbi:MAG: UDP-N-acetylmuramoyl-L-alanyl-D-glutamate--2,6-diaminopimelate ligase [Candidatus Eremiobacteraeota bacterium]|jgi:UDP-N-acetylmuramoyl-L-alanyl-D-glutamate--2,6-diaminopimelate ligase|nr:UDP-N-acetylmuramoyl-L-alanyl-D-glutamate--2,6-diaminopimelate ligase [Candidatus Eremiobacteraeota bacterium]